MEAYSCSSGGVMFVSETIERRTNKQKARSYKEIAGEDAVKTPLREKIFGVIFQADKKSKVA